MPYSLVTVAKSGKNSPYDLWNWMRIEQAAPAPGIPNRFRFPITSAALFVIRRWRSFLIRIHS